MVKINAAIILEVMGKPPTYIKESLEKLIEKIGTEPRVKILSSKINPAKKIKNSELFTTFAEIEFELDSMAELIKIVFTYLPAHVEIVKPENIQINNSELNFLFNQLAMRLHEYDAIAKSAIIDKNMLLQKVKEMSQPAQYNFVDKHKKKK